MSRGSLYRWRKTLATDGLAGLAGRYGNRKGTGLIETDRAVRDFIVARLDDTPGIKAPELMRSIEAAFGATGAQLPSAQDVAVVSEAA